MLRWVRVLMAFGAVEDMTAAEAQGHADTFWNVRWDPVVAELTALEADSDHEADQDVIDNVETYSKELASGYDHVLRWMRALKTLGAIQGMTAAEAQGYADQHLAADRWDPVVEELHEAGGASADAGPRPWSVRPGRPQRPRRPQRPERPRAAAGLHDNTHSHPGRAS